MPDNHNTDCTRIHLHWGALLTIITCLCAVFALGGWLLSDRMTVATSMTAMDVRLTAVERITNDFTTSHNTVVLTSLARIEQSLVDINKQLEAARRIENSDHPRTQRELDKIVSPGAKLEAPVKKNKRLANNNKR